MNPRAALLRSGSLSGSSSTEKNSTMDMGMPLSTLRSELIEGLTLFFSIIEMVLLVTPARLASSRWDSPLSLRMACRRAPTSKGGVLLILFLVLPGSNGRNPPAPCGERVPKCPYHGNTVQYLQQIGLGYCANFTQFVAQSPL